MSDTKLTAAPGDSISHLDLSTRVYNALRRHRIDTIGALAACTRLDLLDIRQLGGKSLGEIEAALAAHGLALAVETPAAAPEPAP